MPVIAMTMAPASTEIKKSLVEELTAKAAEITGIPKTSFVVTLNELPTDALGLGGQTVADMKKQSTR
ncbi:MAG: tautomerase family protein [Deltaproteobacteria bacterium]|nr:tautomerase family protein [Deltaproteobacteria bacterium]